MNESKVPNMPNIPVPPQRKEGESDTVRRRELDQIARQLKGLSDRVKRLKEAS